MATTPSRFDIGMGLETLNTEKDVEGKLKAQDPANKLIILLFNVR